jgi:hypothetical protein
MEATIRFRKATLGVLAVLFLSLSGTALYADPITYGFENVTANSVANATAGEAQLFVEVTAGAGGTVVFTFRNVGPVASSITDIYFDDNSVPSLLGTMTITNGPNVDFSVGASPGDLPGGGAVGFSATTGLTADSTPPSQPNGVNPGEWVTLTFTLQNGQTFTDAVTALANGDLRLGIHVQGFMNGGSESFVNNDLASTPEPGSLVLLGTGLAGLVYWKTRKRK